MSLASRFFFGSPPAVIWGIPTTRAAPRYLGGGFKWFGCVPHHSLVVSFPPLHCRRGNPHCIRGREGEVNLALHIPSASQPGLSLHLCPPLLGWGVGLVYPPPVLSGVSWLARQPQAHFLPFPPKKSFSHVQYPTTFQPLEVWPDFRPNVKPQQKMSPKSAKKSTKVTFFFGNLFNQQFVKIIQDFRFKAPERKISPLLGGGSGTP